MKNLKFKILLTNISRIIRSVIFINLSSIILKMGKVFAVSEVLQNSNEMIIDCYAAVEMPIFPGAEKLSEIVDFLKENTFILLVPIVLIIITIIFATKRIKENKKITEEAKRRIEEKNKSNLN